MFSGDTQVPGDRSSIRELTLLHGETVEDRFVPDSGSVSGTPNKGPLLVLTSRRLISFVENNGSKETVLAPLEELDGVSVKGNTRGFRDLFQGLFLVLVGIVTYIVLGYILDGVTVALALGAAIAFVGMLFMGKYLFWEEEGSITFQAGSWELSFPYRNDRASADLYKLIDRFFQLRLNTDGAPATLDEAPTASAAVETTEDAPPETEPAPVPYTVPWEEPQAPVMEAVETREEQGPPAYRPWWAQGSSPSDP